MKDFKSGKRPSRPKAPNGRSFGGEKRSFNAHTPRFAADGGSNGLYAAICASCGDRCQVPFKPNGLKEVFCNNCFNAGGSKPLRKPGGKPSFSQSRDFGATATTSTGISKSQLDRIESKLDRILDLLDDE